MGRCEPCKNLKAEVGVLRRCLRLRRRSWTLGPASAEVWATAQDRIEPGSRSRAPIDTTPLPKQDARTTVQAHADSPVTRIVEEPASVAIDCDWISSPYSDGFVHFRIGV